MNTATHPTYVCLKTQLYTEGAYTVVPLRRDDIFLIKQWRNEQMKALRQQAPLTDAQQEAYYDTVVAPLFTQSQPQQLLFSFLLDDRCIGYGGLVHVNWDHRRAEFSYLVETSRHEDTALYARELGVFFGVMKQIAFGDLNLHRITTETYDFRPYVIEAIEAHGLKPEGRLRAHVQIDGAWVDSLVHGCLSTD